MDVLLSAFAAQLRLLFTHQLPSGPLPDQYTCEQYHIQTGEV